MALKNVLKATTDSELLSYIINVTPELQSEIDLPVQGQSIKPIGKIILDNERYKNAFINTVNLIGLTAIKRNAWDNPWDFTTRGTLRFGQQIREIINDLCNVYDYNDVSNDSTRFLESVVPNVYNYMHEVNFQKYYEQTTSDEQLAMAFDSEGGLFELIDNLTSMLYESMMYDRYIIDKYMLCRRILDGTMTSVKIDNYANLTPRQRVSALKSISNKMTFRSPNYNPAGIRRATSFEKQIAIINTEFEADLTTEVLATSFFRDEAEMKSRMKLIDGFNNHDTERLTEVLGNQYVPFTSEELTALASIPAVIISDEWFMDYDYSLDANAPTKQTDFYNPTTLKRNIFLHSWRVFSTSPFEQAVVFTSETPTVNSVTVSPNQSSVSAGLSLQLQAVVDTDGFANKAVQWTVEKAEGEVTKVTVDANGLVMIPSDFVTSGVAPQVTIRATSIFNPSVYGEATITVL